MTAGAQPLRIAETLPECTSRLHPDKCVANLHSFASPTGQPWRWDVAYSWDSGTYYRPDDEALNAAGNVFLTAHGIDPKTFMIGNKLTVRVRCDGTLLLDTWRAVAVGDDGGYLLCEHCPGCARQQRVVAPLVAPVPMLPGAYLSDRVTVPTVQVGAAVTAPAARAAAGAVVS